MEDVQVGGLHAQLDIIPGEDLGAFRATDTLHGALLRTPANGDGTDCALVLKKLGGDSTC
jgi:hypothetical protein